MLAFLFFLMQDSFPFWLLVTTPHLVFSRPLYAWIGSVCVRVAWWVVSVWLHCSISACWLEDASVLFILLSLRRTSDLWSGRYLFEANMYLPPHFLPLRPPYPATASSFLFGRSHSQQDPGRHPRWAGLGLPRFKRSQKKVKWDLFKGEEGAPLSIAVAGYLLQSHYACQTRAISHSDFRCDHWSRMIHSNVRRLSSSAFLYVFGKLRDTRCWGWKEILFRYGEYEIGLIMDVTWCVLCKVLQDRKWHNEI